MCAWRTGATFLPATPSQAPGRGGARWISSLRPATAAIRWAQALATTAAAWAVAWQSAMRDAEAHGEASRVVAHGGVLPQVD